MIDLSDAVEELTNWTMADIDRQVMARPDADLRAAYARSRPKVVEKIRLHTAKELAKAADDLEPEREVQ